MKTLFPEDFIWSTSSAAVQVEGAWNEGGKGESIWDTLVHEGGHVAHGENGDVACDQYHRFREDVAIMKELGLTAYRFSISWPRVLPEGTGRINEEGIQYYSDLCDELIKAGIKPMATLYHWDYPMELYKKGGWKNDRSSDWFEEYTEVISSALKDKVYLWMTFNEPQMFCGLGYRLGFHAPFEHVSDEELIGITKNVLLSHGKAVSVLRKNCPNSKIGMAPTGDCCCPKTSDPEALEEARKQSFSIKKDFIMSNAWWADPIFLGKYPEEAAELFGDKMYSFSEKEWAIVSQKLDFYGFNCYQGTVTMPAPADGYDEYGYQGSPKTVYNWNIMPESLYYSSKFLYNRYQLPVLVTENGYAGLDFVMSDGKVHDPQREDYIRRYLKELKKAMDEGIPVLGYSYWSFMDNFEWNSGYDFRFGLVYVDFRTQERIWKDSAYFYKEIISSRGEIL